MVGLTTLGVLDLRRPDGTAVQSVLQQPKRAALLVYLAANTEGYQRRDTLLSLFWPESGEEAARHSLSQAVYKLRQALGAEAILTRGDEEIRLAGGLLACDFAAFESAVADRRYADALELYAGDFLASFHLDGARAFERWADAKRSSLKQTAAKAGWALSREQLSRGAAVEAERSARLAFNLDPASEASGRAFIRELVDAGEPATALAFYDHLKRTLKVELEVEPSGETQALANTIRGQVQESLERQGPSVQRATSSPVSNAASPIALPPETRRFRSSKRYIVFVAASFVLVAVSATRLASRNSAAPTPAIRSLVVLPLNNLARDTAQDYFVEGMYNALVAELAQLSAIRVVPRGVAYRYAGTQVPVGEIARGLKVDAVLRGGVTRSGDSVNVVLELIAANPERILWSAGYKRRLRDVLALYDDVARAVATEIEVELTPRDEQQISGARPVNPAAYDAWLAGSYHANRRSGGDMDACFHFAKLAAAADPNYAPAYALLARCYNIAPYVNTSAPESFEQAKRAARHALALDPTMAAAHADLGWVQAVADWDWQGSERSYRRALQLNPTLVMAEEDLGFLLSWFGRFDEALLHARRAQELDPYSPQASVRTAVILNLARRDDEAIAEARHAVSLDSNYMFAYSRLHWAYFGKGDHSRALAAAQHAARLSGPQDLRRKAFLAHAYAMNGERNAARAILKELLALNSESYVPPTAIATVYAGLGDKDSAFIWLERGYEGRDGDMVLLKVWRAWDPLRDDPRYQALVSRMHFPP